MRKKPFPKINRSQLPTSGKDLTNFSLRKGYAKDFPTIFPMREFFQVEQRDSHFESDKGRKISPSARGGGVEEDRDEETGVGMVARDRREDEEEERAALKEGGDT